LITDYFMTL